ncbi:biotin--[acetyl-CoA-carboxylase] ligase [Gaoshiqia sp. Z1-71]|uniref:biotin--[acetyl-CoA-carboxylase] ligase n=1 Tax=Gaoshiqia hydrogeniformans TaxID=3290090 RepID=UPI003BF8A28F
MSSEIGHTIVRIESTPSTNNYATSQVRENEVEAGTVFLTYRQTAGRGQLSNVWESETGKNLTFSIFLQPAFLDIRRQFLLAKVVCLGLEAFLSELTGQVTIKWPNDIYAGDRKICGVLIENAIMHGQISQSIVGIGVNINQTRFVSDAPNPVSLKMLTGRTYDPDVLLTGLLLKISFFYRKLENGRYRELDEAFLQKLYRLNEWHTYRDETHQYTGRIIGLNEIGQLKIEEKDGPVHEYHFKEVAYL